MRLKEGDRESVSHWCGLWTEHFHLQKFWLWWEIVTVLIKKRGGNIAQSINGRMPNVWVNGVLLNFSFSEWDRCHFFLLTSHGLERVPATQFAEKLSP